jgi:hypothetical protein
MSERLRDLRQAQLRIGGEADLQADERGNDPGADDDSLERGMLSSMGHRAPLSSKRHIHVVLLINVTNRTG